MSINQLNKDQRISVDALTNELHRIRNSKDGEVLFTGTVTPNSSILALLYMSGVQFISCYYPDTHTVQYVREI